MLILEFKILTFQELYYLPVLKHGPRSLTWMRMGKVIKTFLKHEKKLKRYEK